MMVAPFWGLLHMVDAIKYYINVLFDNWQLKLFFSLIVSYLTGIYTSLPDAAKLLIFLLIIDFLLGFTIAVIKWNISSKRLYFGAFKFFAYSIIWHSSYIADKIVFGGTHKLSFSSLVLIYLSTTELVSIIENVNTLSKHFGYDEIIPQRLKKEIPHLINNFFQNKNNTTK